MARILIIDDEQAIRAFLRKMLEREGHEVVEASNGKEGMKEYRTRPADVVVTDIIMPEQEGIQTILELKKEYPNAKVIAISGGGFIEATQYLQIVKTMGVKHAFAKPFERSEILGALKELLS